MRIAACSLKRHAAKQVMFAAPGADMAAADNGGQVFGCTGDVFAAPIVAVSWRKC